MIGIPELTVRCIHLVSNLLRFLLLRQTCPRQREEHGADQDGPAAEDATRIPARVLNVAAQRKSGERCTQKGADPAEGRSQA